MDPAALRRVLVVRIGRIGDMLVVTPALRALQQAASDVQIDVLTSSEGRLVFASNPWVDQVHVLQWRRVPRIINPARAAVVRSLRARNYDAVFLLEGGERYHALIADIDAATVFTFAGNGRPADARHATRGAHHELDNYFAVLRLAGIEPAGRHYDFDIAPASEREANMLLEPHGVSETTNMVAIHAGHFQKPRLGRGPHAKTWPTDRWIELVRRLADAGAERIVLTGSSSERPVNETIAAATRGANIIDLAGRTDLETLAAVIRRATVFIAPDTGPAHLAAAVDTPLVGLFGPKSPDIMGPLGDEALIERLYPEPSPLSDADRGGHHPRMWAITVDDVLSAIDRLGVRFDGAGAS